MTAPVREAPIIGVVRRTRTPVAAWHALATRDGIETLALMVEATRRWKALTGRQRAVLRLAYQAAVAALPPDIPDGTEVELPALPPNVHPVIRRSLTAKGLVAGDQLTVLAVEIVANAVDALTVGTAAVSGGAL